MYVWWIEPWTEAASSLNVDRESQVETGYKVKIRPSLAVALQSLIKSF